MSHNHNRIKGSIRKIICSRKLIVPLSGSPLRVSTLIYYAWFNLLRFSCLFWTRTFPLIFTRVFPVIYYSFLLIFVIRLCFSLEISVIKAWCLVSHIMLHLGVLLKNAYSNSFTFFETKWAKFTADVRKLFQRFAVPGNLETMRQMCIFLF